MNIANLIKTNGEKPTRQDKTCRGGCPFHNGKMETRILLGNKAGKYHHSVMALTGLSFLEGFDCRGLSTLLPATPIKFDGRLTQYIGRVMRQAPRKDKAKVYNYDDGNIGVLRAAANSRRRVYAQAS